MSTSETRIFVPVRVAVYAGWGTVGGPSRVRNANVGIEDLSEVWLLCRNKLLELCNLAHLFECENLVSLVAVDCQTC